MTHNLPMSVPHRLLGMLLRREGLEDHETLDSLLGGTEHRIKIKESMLSQPVCRAGGRRGLSVSENPMSAEALSRYVRDASITAGYPLGITMYAWRRKAATIWVRAFGTERARQMMDHEAGSDTIFQHMSKVCTIIQSLKLLWVLIQLYLP